MSGPVRHLYVHVPFCARRCGYCDFVTVVGRSEGHSAYVDAVLSELELEGDVLAGELETVFLGGGTPTYMEPAELRRLLNALPAAPEVTVEANPETVQDEVVELLLECGVNRISLGAQSFRSHVLEVLDRVVHPDTVRRAFYHLRDAGFDNISLDLIYGVPGQSAADVEADLRDAVALEPEHLSCYELEAKPGTRFTHRYGSELAQQAEAMEVYFELVVRRLTNAGYRWYETANFCRPPESSGGRDLRARHNVAYWLGRDYLGVGTGAVSTVGGRRWRNTPKLAVYVSALALGTSPPRDVEPLPEDVRRRERVMLGLRLDEPLSLAGLDGAIDVDALDKLSVLGLAEQRVVPGKGSELRLTPRGRFLGGGVAAELVV